MFILPGAPNHTSGWGIFWILAPAVFWVIYWIWRSYRRSLKRPGEGNGQTEDMAAGLHLRTIEALALAIEAKDYTSHTQFRRIDVYAMEIGKELGLGDVELQA